MADQLINVADAFSGDSNEQSTTSLAAIVSATKPASAIMDNITITIKATEYQNRLVDSKGNTSQFVWQHSLVADSSFGAVSAIIASPTIPVGESRVFASSPTFSLKAGTIQSHLNFGIAVFKQVTHAAVPILSSYPFSSPVDNNHFIIASDGGNFKIIQINLDGTIADVVTGTRAWANNIGILGRKLADGRFLVGTMQGTAFWYAIQETNGTWGAAQTAAATAPNTSNTGEIILIEYDGSVANTRLAVRTTLVTMIISDTGVVSFDTVSEERTSKQIYNGGAKTTTSRFLNLVSDIEINEVSVGGINAAAIVGASINDTELRMGLVVQNPTASPITGTTVESEQGSLTIAF